MPERGTAAVDPARAALLHPLRGRSRGRLRDAALARAFDFLGKRWNAVILGILGGGPTGFRNLSRAIGRISDSVLSDRLAELTSAGLITRTVDGGPPVSVSYALTDCGKALMPALEQIARWAQEHLPPGGQ